MRLSTVLGTMAMAATTLAAPTNFVKNNCPFSVWITSVAKVPHGEAKEVKSGTTWTEQQYFDAPAGTSIDIVRSGPAGLFSGSPVLVFGYTYHAGQDIYYDLGQHAGFDFDGLTIKLYAKDGSGLIVWQGHPEPQNTKAYFGETDLYLDLCA